MKEGIYYTNNISWGLLGSKAFVFNEKSRDIFMLSNISKDIWMGITELHDLDKLILYLNYKNSYNCETNVKKIVMGLINKNLLECVI